MTVGREGTPALPGPAHQNAHVRSVTKRGEKLRTKGRGAPWSSRQPSVPNVPAAALLHVQPAEGTIVVALLRSSRMKGVAHEDGYRDRSDAARDRRDPASDIGDGIKVDVADGD